MDMVELLNEIVRAGHEVRVLYTTGSWFDVDRIHDMVEGNTFQ